MKSRDTLIPTPAQWAAHTYPQPSLSLASHIEIAQQTKARRKHGQAKRGDSETQVPGSSPSSAFIHEEAWSSFPWNVVTVSTCDSPVGCHV